jgi:hypothetical protein
MAPITTSVDVERSAEAVFVYAIDPSHFAEWQQGVVDGAMESSGIPEVGDHCLTTRRIGLTNRTSTAEVTRIEPPHVWSVRGLDGPIRAVVDVAVERLSDARARLSVSVDFEGHGIGRLLVPLFVTRQARKEMPGNVAALKRRLEAP